ncbi:GPW/gp25 family protein [Aliifodinibius salicampi]|uniref:GPW/gp25 family protein n=1 Tax=Fodinibius salicampi TaxID=1920655 RepID=A0ABT3PYZ2_9BACT|nr:GPW/gp25 family protein [Fodinibius salicampi]MCW9713092.1 GPW/gp25 family protein [Fodinibius salicampi]
MENGKDFLGSGWSFPPAFDKEDGKVQLTHNREDIERSLEILVGTRKGERVMRPEYGCNLDDMVFESFNLSMKTYLADLVETAILYYEPRIEPLNINIDETFIYEGRLMIEIEYLIRATNSRFNKVFPFYLEEGTEI